MKKIMDILIGLTLIVSLSVNANTPEYEIATALRNNVVTIQAEWESGDTHNGFGWIVGDDEKYVYFVTADHVLRGGGPDETAKNISVKLFGEPLTRKAELLPHHDEKNDLAIFRMKIPDNRMWRYLSADTSKLEKNRKITFIGKNTNWFIPERAGHVFKVSNDKIIVKGLSIDVGTSGAPLLSDKGIVGLIGSDTGTSIHVYPLSEIEKNVRSWGYPWLLDTYKITNEVSGTWAPRTANVPKNIRITFEKLDSSHVKYKIQDPSNRRGAEGRGVIDGGELRIWHPLPGGQKSKGKFEILGSDTSLEPARAMLMLGYIQDGDKPFTQVRLVRLGDNGKIEPLAEKFLAKNPSQIEIFAKELQHTADTQGEDAARALLNPIIEKQGVPSVNPMITGALRSMKTMFMFQGMPNVDLSINKNCLQATGRVPSAKHKNKVDKMLKKIVKGIEEQFLEEYDICNLTTVG